MDTTFIIHDSIVTESPSRFASRLEDIIGNYDDSESNHSENQ